jgi:hypothetical protein
MKDKILKALKQKKTYALVLAALGLVGVVLSPDMAQDALDVLNALTEALTDSQAE